jgi:cell division protein FtsB
MKYRKDRKGKRPKSLFFSPFVLVAAVVVSGVLLRAALSLHHKAILSGAKLAETQSEYDKLQAHGAELEKQVGYLSSDDGVESELRSKYRAVKSGELVAVIVDQNQNASVTAATSSPAKRSSWWIGFLSFFGL